MLFAESETTVTTVGLVLAAVSSAVAAMFAYLRNKTDKEYDRDQILLKQRLGHLEEADAAKTLTIERNDKRLAECEADRDALRKRVDGMVTDALAEMRRAVHDTRDAAQTTITKVAVMAHEAINRNGGDQQKPG